MTKPPLPEGRVRTPRFRNLSSPSTANRGVTLNDLIRRVDTGAPTEVSISDIRLLTDRSLAIAVGASVERSLETIIIAHLKKTDKATIDKLVGREGALASFYGKIHLGFAMGLYPKKTLQQLDVIRQVRNVFAHAPTFIDFKTPPIPAEIAKLKNASPASRSRSSGRAALAKALVDAEPSIIFVRGAREIIAQLQEIMKEKARQQ